MWYEVYAEPRLRENTKDYYLNYICTPLLVIYEIEIILKNMIYLVKTKLEGKLMQKGHNLETMLRILKGFMTDMETDLSAFLESDNLQDAKAIADIANESISETITLFKAIRNIASIPSQLFLHKFEHYCKGLGNIPKEKREKYIQMLGKEKFNREGVFVLNIINRIEENDKIDFLLRLLESKLDGEIDDTTYRRLMVLVDRTLYSDLLYLKDHVTKRPIEIGEREEFGLVASGLISSDGLGWESVTAGQPTVLLFRYTPAAQQLAEILFGKQQEY